IPARHRIPGAGGVRERERGDPRALDARLAEAVHVQHRARALLDELPLRDVGWEEVRHGHSLRTTAAPSAATRRAVAPSTASRSRPSTVIFTLWSAASMRGYDPTATSGNAATTASSVAAMVPSPSRE